MKKTHIIFLIIFVVALGTILFVLPNESREGPGRWISKQGLSGTVTSLFGWFTEPVAAFKRWFSRADEGMKSLDDLSQHNSRLVWDNSRLRAENDRLRQLVTENSRLKAMLGFEQDSPFELVAARIISRDSSTWWQGLLIDKGFEDGLQANMPVISEQGLVGKLTTILKNQSRMILVLDENCKVSAVIEENREQGIVTGTREGNEINPVVRMTYISRKADIKPGMSVLTSGLGGIFPPGIRIGTIREVKISSQTGNLGLYKDATLQPSVDMSNLEYVFVVVKSSKAPVKKK
ncbi:MAG: rod shape-determining protein MreC [Verrucomicrobiae bacterium]|nr:rod shape-determining protein MreC [Verrucomicrobiae bacterium]